MSELPVDLQLCDSSATEALGVALARAYLAAGAGAAVLYLKGELGAGKTTCVRSLLRSLGVTGPIRSPSYTLVETYELPALTCVHVDLYRLQGPEEVDELGLRDYLGGRCLLMVEWPEKGGAVLASADVELSLSYCHEARRGHLVAHSPAGRRWLGELEHDTSLTPYVSHLT